MNQKDDMMIHIKLDHETHKKMKHICVDLDMSIVKYIKMLVKKGNEKNE